MEQGSGVAELTEHSCSQDAWGRTLWRTGDVVVTGCSTLPQALQWLVRYNGHQGLLCIRKGTVYKAKVGHRASCLGRWEMQQ